VLYSLSHQFSSNFKPKNLSKKWVYFIQYYKWNNHIKKHVFVDYSILVKKFEEEVNNPLKIEEKKLVKNKLNISNS
jgi:hypothetical protein